MNTIKQWIAKNEMVVQMAAQTVVAFLGLAALFYGSVFLTIWLIGVMK